MTSPSPNVDGPVVVAGVDGCRGGWVVVRLFLAPHQLVSGAPTTDMADATIHVVDSLASTIAEVRTGTLALLGIDMPIGLPDRSPRSCDRQARALLGPRRSSVFSAPARTTLGSPDHAAATAASRAALGVGMSIQTFHLLDKIAHLDSLIDPSIADRVLESHPEACFVSLTGAPLPPKRTPGGRAERMAALEPLVAAIASWAATPPRPARPDDVLDAAVVATAMVRHLAGDTTVLGDGATDGRDLPMQIIC